VDTIVSPEALIESSTEYVQWRQTGYKNPDIPGMLELMDASGSIAGTLSLYRKNNLYYCESNTFALEHDVSRAACSRALTAVSKASHIESETWLLRLGSPGENQLQLLPRCSTGIPDKLECHPFRYTTTRRNKRLLRSNHQHPNIPTACLNVVTSSTWILGSCAHQHQTTNTPTNQLTG